MVTFSIGYGELVFLVVGLIIGMIIGAIVGKRLAMKDMKDKISYESGNLR